MLRGALGTQRFVQHEEQNRLPHRQNTLTLTPEHARQHDAQAFLFVTLCNTIIYKMTGYTVLSCYVATLDNCNKIKHPLIYSDGIHISVCGKLRQKLVLTGFLSAQLSPKNLIPASMQHSALLFVSFFFNLCISAVKDQETGQF